MFYDISFLYAGQISPTSSENWSLLNSSRTQILQDIVYDIHFSYQIDLKFCTEYGSTWDYVYYIWYEYILICTGVASMMSQNVVKSWFLYENRWSKETLFWSKESLFSFPRSAGVTCWPKSLNRMPKTLTAVLAKTTKYRPRSTLNLRLVVKIHIASMSHWASVVRVGDLVELRDGGRSSGCAILDFRSRDLSLISPEIHHHDIAPPYQLP